MIDLHVHILPGIDDGPSHRDTALAMARIAVADGIRALVATPHHGRGRFHNPRDEVFRAVDRLREALDEAKISLDILPGQEVHITPDILQQDAEGELLTLNVDTPYLLLEPPYQRLPRELDETLFRLQLKGYQPILAHPERNEEFRQEPNRLYRLVDQGVLAQVTAGSLTGRFGEEVEAFSWRCLEHNLFHVLGSDAHDPRDRAPRLTATYRVIGERAGVEYVRLFKNNSRRIIAGEACRMPQPERFRRSWWDRLRRLY